MSDDFTPEDIHQMSEQGDLRAFMRSLIKKPDEKRDFPAATPPQSREDGRPVGAWPQGTHRPGCTMNGPAATRSDGEHCDGCGTD